MKKLLFIIFLFPLTCFCQEIKLPTDSSGKVIYSEVINLDSNLSANELFKRAKSWFVQTYNSSKEVIQDADQETHTITGKALMIAHMTVMGATNNWGHVKYFISITCKDGRYRIIISDFFHENEPYVGIGIVDNNVKSDGVNFRKKDYSRVVEEVNNYALSLIASIKEAMNKKLSSSNDW